MQEVVTALMWRMTGSDPNETWRLPRATDELAAGAAMDHPLFPLLWTRAP